jgi:hypothetical protein
MPHAWGISLQHPSLRFAPAHGNGRGERSGLCGIRAEGYFPPHCWFPPPFTSPEAALSMRTTLLLLALALAVAPPLAGQAPTITEQGDPTIRADTLYRLAVDPADYPDEDDLYLFDDGVVKLEADGRGSRTYRYVVQLLTREAAENWGELTFGWDRNRERFRLNWARVIDASTGKVISDGPVHDQESLAPVAENAPVYTDRQRRRISLGGVAPGTIVDYSYTTETLEPVLAGDFLAGWSIHTGRVTRRSRYLLDLPAGYEPRIFEENLDFRRRTTTRGGRVVHDWTRAEIPKIEGEPYMATDSNTVFMNLAIGGRTDWQDIARWYDALSRDRYALTPEIEAKADEVVRGAATREDSLRALHRWIAQDFRYVSLSLGIGGYQPRTPAEVFETQYGDCKDKATLFIALANRIGARAYPVLLSGGGGVDRRLPSIHQFDHMIAAVERPEGGYTFLDLTADLIPYGEISPGYQGEFGLVIHPGGRAEEITFPLNDPATNRTEMRIVGELTTDGSFTGTFETTSSGVLQYQLRSAFAARPTSKQREAMERNIAQNVYEGARGENLEVFDGKDLHAQPRVGVRVVGGRAATRSGGTLILQVPFENGSMQTAIADLEARKEPRRFDINVNAVIGPVEIVRELRVTLPEGYRARLPQSVTAESVFGRFTAEYTQEGRELRVTRSYAGTRGTQPKERLPDLIAFFREMSQDDVVFIVVEPGAE